MAMRLYDFVCGQVSSAVLAAVIVYASASAQQLNPAPVLLDAADIRTTVSEVAAVIAREYMDAAIGADVAAYLTRLNGEGRYGPQTAEQLAATLTRDLFERSRDKHLAVSVVRES